MRNGADLCSVIIGHVVGTTYSGCYPCLRPLFVCGLSEGTLFALFYRGLAVVVVCWLLA